MRDIEFAALLLGLSIFLAACGVMSKGNRKASMPAPNGDGIYVASVPYVDMVDAMGAGIPYFLGIDVTDFPFGLAQLGVLNRWNGAVGAHQEETRLLDRNDKIVVSDKSELKGTDRGALQRADMAQTCDDVLDISKLQPGSYQIAVYLDGREYARYSIRIIAPPDQQQTPGAKERRQ